MAKSKLAPAKVREAARALFDEHGWPGTVIGCRAESVLGATNPCPNGGTPHEITYLDENGKWVTKTVCL
jgi:hypothetical protein